MQQHQHTPEHLPRVVWVQLFWQRHRVGLSLLQQGLTARTGIVCCCGVEGQLPVGVCLRCCQLLLCQQHLDAPRCSLHFWFAVVLLLVCAAGTAVGITSTPL